MRTEISKHRSVLAGVAIVARRRDGNRVHHRIDAESVFAIWLEQIFSGAGW